uniref:Uncharacterized protein n=1 Tax=Arundo donax TaxID=35708 RepID=A0A0A9FFS9_ARUDO
MRSASGYIPSSVYVLSKKLYATLPFFLGAIRLSASRRAINALVCIPAFIKAFADEACPCQVKSFWCGLALLSTFISPSTSLAAMYAANRLSTLNISGSMPFSSMSWNMSCTLSSCLVSK